MANLQGSALASLQYLEKAAPKVLVIAAASTVPLPCRHG
jgi:hypothetical protein